MSNIPKADGYNAFQAISPGICQKITVNGTSAPCTNAFGASTTLVRIYATDDCHIKFAIAPVAAADGTCTFMGAGTSEYFGVSPGQKVAAIQDSAGGVLYITEGA